MQGCANVASERMRYAREVYPRKLASWATSRPRRSTARFALALLAYLSGSDSLMSGVVAGRYLVNRCLTGAMNGLTAAKDYEIVSRWTTFHGGGGILCKPAGKFLLMQRLLFTPVVKTGGISVSRSTEISPWPEMIHVVTLSRVNRYIIPGGRRWFIVHIPGLFPLRSRKIPSRLLLACTFLKHDFENETSLSLSLTINKRFRFH